MTYNISHPTFLKEQKSEEPDLTMTENEWEELLDAAEKEGLFLVRQSENGYMFVNGKDDGTVSETGPFTKDTLIGMFGIGVVGILSQYGKSPVARLVLTKSPHLAAAGILAAGGYAAGNAIGNSDIVQDAAGSVGEWWANTMPTWLGGVDDYGLGG
ncbi:MAG: hypothetical protein H8D80_00195 [Proteobacteria bacterium]|nr:hypothetical protein [Pseudomonadota bacterium]